MKFGISLACAFILIVGFQGSEGYYEHFSSTVNKFSNKFFEVLANQSQGNLIVSPFSALNVLSMGICGADDDTRGEALQVLRMALNEKFVLTDYRNFILELQQNTNPELYVRSRIFVQNNVPIKKHFSAIIKAVFQSEAEPINFHNTLEAARRINAWGQKETRNKIKSIVTPDALQDTLVAMVNAVYFKGKWAIPFDSELIDMPFQISKDETVVLPMMYRAVPNAVMIFDDTTWCIELPYETGDRQNEMSMFIIYPSEDYTVDDIAHRLHEINFAELENQLGEETDFYMPKFKINSELDIIPTLQAMGIRKMFEDGANFRLLSSHANLKIDKIIQKGFLSVDEKGSEAAVLTAATFVNRIAPAQVILNKPFFAAIVKKSTWTPLFWARINDPRI